MCISPFPSIFLAIELDHFPKSGLPRRGSFEVENSRKPRFLEEGHFFFVSKTLLLPQSSKLEEANFEELGSIFDLEGGRGGGVFSLVEGDPHAPLPKLRFSRLR